VGEIKANACHLQFSSAQRHVFASSANSIILNVIESSEPLVALDRR
jgi:hypothetical protein